MHKYFPKVYCFVNEFNPKELSTINKNIGIIYRNYTKKVDEKTLISLKKYCKKNNQKVFLANNLKIAKKLSFDGVYIPSFNKMLNTKNISKTIKFDIIGSAHNEIDIKIKEKQGCSKIFLAPTFKVLKSKNYLGILKFNKLALSTGKKIISLGGINETNIRKLNLLICCGFAGISWVKKNGPSKLRPFLKF
jgi:thiamine-phosphate pyrophosphorylase